MNKGFSLVELIVVIAIMAILVGVAVPVYTGYISKAKDGVDAQYDDELQRAIDTVKIDLEAGLSFNSSWDNTNVPVYIKIDGAAQTDKVIALDENGDECDAFIELLEDIIDIEPSANYVEGNEPNVGGNNETTTPDAQG